MNILHLSAVKIWGGGENHIVNLCTELTPEVTNTILCRKNSEFEFLLRSKTGLEVVAAPLYFKMDPRYFLQLIRVCRDKKIDLIHIHDSTALALAVIADKFGNLPPFVFSKKTSFPIRNRKFTKYKYNYSKLRRILCVSKATLTIAKKQINDKKTLTCIYHGTSLKDKQIQENLSLKSYLNLDKDKMLIGNIANHTWAKDLKTFVMVAKELIHHRGYTMLHFIQIGKFSKETQELQNLIKDHKLEDHISLLNSIDKASGLIPQFEVALVTSKSEGIPQFIYESFYFGTPVVSTRVGGIPEVIAHNHNGLLAPAKDHIQLAEHILRLINNPDLQKQFIRISRDKLLHSFTSEMMAHQTLQEYKKILNGRS